MAVSLGRPASGRRLGRLASIRTASRKWLTSYSGAGRASRTPSRGRPAVLAPAGQLPTVHPLNIGELVRGTPADRLERHPASRDQDYRGTDEHQHPHEDQEEAEPGPQ